MAKTHPSSTGVCVSLAELIKLQFKARGFSLLPRQPVQSLLAGRYGSKLRGRGLNFEEIRQYRPGDDIRNMDWKVTARTGKPHTRIYTEERDRPIVVVVDQRIPMFFGSKVNMKSVTAAHLAALAVWKGFQDGDRAGAFIFNDREIKQIKAHRSKKNITTILSSLVDYNEALVAKNKHSPQPEMLNRVLQQVAAQATHDSLYLIISDFLGLNQESYRFIKALSQRNDLLLCLIHDPLAMKLPKHGIVTFTDGIDKSEIDTSNKEIHEKLPLFIKERIANLRNELDQFGVPTLPLNNKDDVADQLRGLLGKNYWPGKSF